MGVHGRRFRAGRATNIDQENCPPLLPRVRTWVVRPVEHAVLERRDLPTDRGTATRGTAELLSEFDDQRVVRVDLQSDHLDTRALGFVVGQVGGWPSHPINVWPFGAEHQVRVRGPNGRGARFRAAMLGVRLPSNAQSLRIPRRTAVAPASTPAPREGLGVRLPRTAQETGPVAGPIPPHLARWRSE